MLTELFCAGALINILATLASSIAVCGLAHRKSSIVKTMTMGIVVFCSSLQTLHSFLTIYSSLENPTNRCFLAVFPYHGDLFKVISVPVQSYLFWFALSMQCAIGVRLMVMLKSMYALRFYVWGGFMLLMLMALPFLAPIAVWPCTEVFISINSTILLIISVRGNVGYKQIIPLSGYFLLSWINLVLSFMYFLSLLKVGILSITYPMYNILLIFVVAFYRDRPGYNSLV